MISSSPCVFRFGARQPMVWGCLAYVTAVWIAPTPAAGNEKPRIELHIIAAPSVGPLAPHDWLEKLKELPVDSLRISTGTGDEKPTLARDAGSLRITGVLKSADTLFLPGARFTSRDQARLATWLSNAANGVDEGAQSRGAFGLTSQQLLALHQSLSRRTVRNTRGADMTDVLEELLRDADVPVKISPAARARLQDPFSVADELRGLSHGTTIAALLRPAGLMMYPTDAGQTLTIDTVTLPADETTDNPPESWPIGWPLAGKPRDVAPIVYRKLEISFENVELSRAIEALQQRMKVPVVLNRNGLARKQIDISSVRVSLPKGRTYYKRALEVAVRQAKLRAELRIDEAGTPFFWVSPRTIRAGQ